MPVPRGTDDRLNIVILRLPAEDGLRLFRGRDELRRVARTASCHLALDGLPDDLFRRRDDLLNREADAVAEVEHVILAAVHQIFRGEDVRGSKVGDVDVVAHARAVARGIIVAEDVHVVALAVRDLQHDRNQVRFRIMRLADLARHVCAAGVEVAQRDKMNAVCDGSPVEHPLHRQLRVAVAVRGMRRVGFQNRHSLRFAVGRGGGGEDNVLHAMLDHALEHRARAAEVVVVILERIDHALADLRVRGEVDDCVNFLRREHMVAEFLVADVALIEARLWMHRCPESGLQIVRYDHVVAVVNQLIYRVAVDVARAA